MPVAKQTMKVQAPHPAPTTATKPRPFALERTADIRKPDDFTECVGETDFECADGGDESDTASNMQATEERSTEDAAAV